MVTRARAEGELRRLHMTVRSTCMEIDWNTEHCPKEMEPFASSSKPSETLNAPHQQK